MKNPLNHYKNNNAENRTHKNLAGITISGDFHDLEMLVDAFYAVTIDEDNEKYAEYFHNSTRVLGLCYEIRHAMQGDRDIVFVENGLNDLIMQYQKIRAPLKNVYFSCNYLYPEMCFAVMAINELIEIYIKKIAEQHIRDLLTLK